MVFVNKDWNGTGEIVVYSNYHKYWLDRERRIKNPLFDIFSGKILDLKERKPAAIQYFYNLLNGEICDGVTICVVPSSDAEKVESGIGDLARKLAKEKRIDKVYFLQRTKSIDKLALGGSRDKDVHFQTISTMDEVDVKGDIILLMDDVTTTGNSLYVCKEILKRNGAGEVEMFALGKSI
ncbi:MAG: hypothetical protein Q4C91_22440 [Eubacteriales bacterium]|nr:hypothetical protein [Eubacteriales bacterium]